MLRWILIVYNLIFWSLFWPIFYAMQLFFFVVFVCLLVGFLTIWKEPITVHLQQLRAGCLSCSQNIFLKKYFWALSIVFIYIYLNTLPKWALQLHFFNEPRCFGNFFGTNFVGFEWGKIDSNYLNKYTLFK